MALLIFLFRSLSTEHVVFFVLRVLAVFGLNATLIFSLIIILVISLRRLPVGRCRLRDVGRPGPVRCLVLRVERT